MKKTTSNRRHRFTTKKREIFLSVVAAGGTVTEAARQAGVSRRTPYYLRDRAPAFAEAWKQAEDESVQVLEAEAFRRAIGWLERREDKQGNVYHEHVHSDLLLIFLLKARRPEVYRQPLKARKGIPMRVVIDLRAKP